ncbi:MAG: hypothetical protein WB774_23690 [Xanthobacteraceae bacterium]
MTQVKVAPKGMGLNDFVAMQEGFFAAEGLDVDFDWKTFRGTQSSWKELNYFQRPLYRGRCRCRARRLLVGNHLQRQRRHGPRRY